MRTCTSLLICSFVVVLGWPSCTKGQEPSLERPLFSPASGPLAGAVNQLRQGNYDEALPALQRLARASDASPLTLRTYGRALMEVGRYDDARRVLEGRGGGATHPDLENTLGELYYTVGQLPEAEDAFRRAIDGNAPDYHLARLNLGIVNWDRGDREEALALFDSFIDLYNRSRQRLSPEELTAVGVAVWYLGVTNSGLYQDALMAFDDAVELDPEYSLPDLLAGELFIEKSRATDARESLRPVLERNPRHPRALLGQARILDLEGAGGSVELVRLALEVNPRYADAHTFLASLFLKTEDYGQARRQAREALKTNPAHLGALSVVAAAEFLDGNQEAYERTRAEVHALNPTYPDLYIIVAEAAVTQRQYQTAVDMAGRAVELDPSSWRGYGVMGMNQLRTGAVEEGRQNLEKAWAGDPHNPWYLNTLDLLDTFEHYEKVSTPHFEIFVHEREAELLGPLAAEVAEEAFVALQARYGATPPTPIRLEIYPSHPDFSVRTLGLTGLGALGVSFGSTLVMDSPSALDPGSFNWASTIWHETAHAFHLAMSDHRVPRWFTEGLAVHEQHLARERWGHKASPTWLRAYQDGRLHPVSHLNQGFIRPEYPEQVVHSYYQASLVFELIEEEWGQEAILAMLEGYRNGYTTDQVMREVLGTSPGAFDDRFDHFVRDRWVDELNAVTPPEAPEDPGNFQARLSLGRALVEEGRYDEAEPELLAALALFPEYGGKDGPLKYLAQVHIHKGELRRAAEALTRMGALSETLLLAHAEAAGLWVELGEKGAAAEALENVVEINPFDLDAHQDLAAIYEELEEWGRAVRERRALLALDPPNRAEAHYRLAVALAGTGDRSEARTQVLRALEIAPTFEAALELLLELRRGEQAEDGEGEPVQEGEKKRETELMGAGL